MRRELLVRHLMDDLRRIVRALRSSHRAAGYLTLTGAQLFVIKVLGEAGRPLSVNELAEATETTQSLFLVRATAEIETPTEWLDVNAALSLFAPDREIAQNYYREFVLAKIGCTERIWDKAINGMYLGGEAWAKRMRKIVESKPRSTDHPVAQRAIARPKMHAVIAAVARVAGQMESAIRAMRGATLRRLAAWLGWYEGWATLRSIAASLRLRSEGHVSGMIRRCDREFGVNPVLLQQLDGTRVMLR